MCLDNFMVTTLPPEHFACLWVLTYVAYFGLLSLRLQLPSFADDFGSQPESQGYSATAVVALTYPALAQLSPVCIPLAFSTPGLVFDSPLDLSPLGAQSFWGSFPLLCGYSSSAPHTLIPCCLRGTALCSGPSQLQEYVPLWACCSWP